MKTLKKIAFLVMGLQFSGLTYGANTPATPPDLATVIQEEGDALRQTILISGTNTQLQIAKILDGIFKGEFDGSDKLVKKGVFFELADMFSKNFYDWYTTSKFPLISEQPQLDFKKKVLVNELNIGTLLAKDYGYNFLRSGYEKGLDAAALLSAPVEKGVNNIDPKVLKLPSSLASFGSSKFFTHDSIFPQKSLHDKSPIVEEMPNIQDLLGVDGYADNSIEQQRAQLFIGYLLNASTGSDSFQIPEKPSIGSVVEVCTPKNMSGENSCATVKIKGGGYDSYNSEYDAMVAYFNNNASYREHKNNVRNASILRANNTEPVYRAYQNRTKAKPTEKSLVELERHMSNEGLDEQYYEKLKSKSMADVNLETLRAINKLVYFTHKVHLDNEQMKIILSAMASAVSKLGAAQDVMTMRNLGSAIKERCWDEKNREKEACTNPMKALAPIPDSIEM